MQQQEFHLVCLTSILKPARVLPPASNFLSSRVRTQPKAELDQPKPSRNIQYFLETPTPPIYLRYYWPLH
jgi:hypothetical protein